MLTATVDSSAKVDNLLDLLAVLVHPHQATVGQTGVDVVADDVQRLWPVELVDTKQLRLAHQVVIPRLSFQPSKEVVILVGDRLELAETSEEVVRQQAEDDGEGRRVEEDVKDELVQAREDVLDLGHRQLEVGEKRRKEKLEKKEKEERR